MQKRAAVKLQREQETRESEERRMDELLEKVQREGLPALTDEERRFLTTSRTLSSPTIKESADSSLQIPDAEFVAGPKARTGLDPCRERHRPFPI